MWTNIKDKKPELAKEVLVWVDGHRGPAWSNNYALVAYLSPNGNFYEERHTQEPIIGITHWKPLPKGPKS